MAMSGRHTESGDRITLEVEFNQNGGFAADYPTIMARFDYNSLRSCEFQNTTVLILNMDLALGEESDVSVLA